MTLSVPRPADPSQLHAVPHDQARGRRLTASPTIFACCLTLLFCASAGRAYADGGHIALRAANGAYAITLFTAPEPLVSGPADLSLLVQDPSTGEVLSDVTASATLIPSGHQPAALSFPLTHAAARNKLLLAASPVFREPGSYTLLLHLKRSGSQPAGFTTVLEIAPNHRRRTTLLFALVLPLGAILLFLINQYAKQRRRPPPALQ